jgi:hypothetical protein
MKKIALITLATLLLFSCSKDEITQPTESNDTAYTAKAFEFNKDGNEDHDGDDHDEDEGECCSFKYGQWGSCAQGYQVRSWTSRSKTCIPPIDSIQRTCQGAIVQYFYYNPAYNSFRVVCNISGPIHIYNSTGQLTAIVQYETPNCTNCGRWVAVDFLPLGTYQATFYTRTIRFTR